MFSHPANHDQFVTVFFGELDFDRPGGNGGTMVLPGLTNDMSDASNAFLLPADFSPTIETLTNAKWT